MTAPQNTAPKTMAELAAEYGVVSSVGRLQKALDALPS